VPRVRLAGNDPVPWCVMDQAAGSPSLLATASADELFEVVLAVQRTKVTGFQLRPAWGADTHLRQIQAPIRELAAAGVIDPKVADVADEVLNAHRPMLHELPAVTAHNDLALYHIYTGAGLTWVIDWESCVRDELHMLDVAHLIVSHGLARPDWARQLATIAIEHGRREYGCDLTSNLLVAQLERAAGKAYDMLRRRHRQSMPAVEALCAALDGRFLPVVDILPAPKSAPASATA